MVTGKRGEKLPIMRGDNVRENLEAPSVKLFKFDEQFHAQKSHV